MGEPIFEWCDLVPTELSSGQMYGYHKKEFIKGNIGFERGEIGITHMLWWIVLSCSLPIRSQPILKHHGICCDPNLVSSALCSIPIFINSFLLVSYLFSLLSNGSLIYAPYC